MAARSDRRSSTARSSSSAILLGVVMAVVGIWLLVGDVRLGALVIERNLFFGIVALIAAALSLVGGGMGLFRSRSR
ncbi:MAG: hypothetical protein ACTMII_03230 [Brachybacterium sp.]|uniref:hypothetical protein n=1 Tax=Brachybacterium TaxID=43668 RepID=UPI0031E9EB2E